MFTVRICTEVGVMDMVLHKYMGKERSPISNVDSGTHVLAPTRVHNLALYIVTLGERQLAAGYW